MHDCCKQGITRFKPQSGILSEVAIYRHLRVTGNSAKTAFSRPAFGAERVVLYQNGVIAVSRGATLAWPSRGRDHDAAPDSPSESALSRDAYWYHTWKRAPSTTVTLLDIAFLKQSFRKWVFPRLEDAGRNRRSLPYGPAPAPNQLQRLARPGKPDRLV